MKVELKRGVVVNRRPCSPGEQVDVSDSDGRKLISAGAAVRVLEVAAEPAEVKVSAPKKSVRRRNKLDD
jgi:hypothetical protein